MHPSNEREAGAIPPSVIDYRLVFESLPGLFMVLLPDSPRFTILDVTDAFARESLRRRESLVGLGIFEAFPENPDDPEASGVRKLQASLERVLATREPDTMAVQKYDIALPSGAGGGQEGRHWSPVNLPVFSADGRIAYIVHRVEDRRLFSSGVPVTAGLSEDERPKRGAAAARVLLVDDSAEARAYIGALLAPHYVVETAPDGLAALEAIRDRPPDLVLSDVMMPRLDGLGLLRQLRADARTKSIPVILLSARAGEDVSVDGLEIGADDYLTKPFSARELLARVRAHLEINRSRRHWMRELQRANEELEAFSQSVAHDLRSPLTTITGYSSFLLAADGPALGAGQRHQLERIQAAALRMSALIDDLMSLARVNRFTMQFETVDLSRIATTVIARLREAGPARNATVEIPSGLLVRGDSRLLTIALDNLLDNAWKYSAKQSATRIEFGEREESGERVFFVRDNGAGFDMAYVHKLFVPFERLHPSSEFSGTGIGLTTARRAIERHDGRIWVTAAPGEGATFFFTIGESENRDE
ncbi:MAG: response regulator [Thermoanaerobaculia bacterium]|nr:response regulator [Thermoanaerobaculia bacterium]